MRYFGRNTNPPHQVIVRIVIFRLRVRIRSRLRAQCPIAVSTKEHRLEPGQVYFLLLVVAREKKSKVSNSRSRVEIALRKVTLNDTTVRSPVFTSSPGLTFRKVVPPGFIEVLFDIHEFEDSRSGVAAIDFNQITTLRTVLQIIHFNIGDLVRPHAPKTEI